MCLLTHLLRVAIAMIGLGSTEAKANLSEDMDEPSAAEIGHIERHVTLPTGAASLAEYVRYYHVSPESGRRVIVAWYVKKQYVESSAIPKDSIVVVGSDAEVPAPWDAGCSVVMVRYVPEDIANPSAGCSPELFPEPDHAAEHVALVSLLGTLLLWFTWPSRGQRMFLRRIPPWNVAIASTAWIWLSVEIVLNQSTGCGPFGDFRWRCWDFSIAYTYIWLGLAGMLFISSLLAVFGSRIGRTALLVSLSVLAFILLIERTWSLQSWVANDGLMQLAAFSALLGLSAWALLRKNAKAFYAKSAQQSHARDVRNARA
jgi:hypothetical protein